LCCLLLNLSVKSIILLVSIRSNIDWHIKCYTEAQALAEAGADKTKPSKDDKKSHEKDKRDLQTSALNFAARGGKADIGGANVKPAAQGAFKTPSPVSSTEATPDPISVYLQDSNARKIRELEARLEKEKEDDAIFEMASAGFESTVRLAKSSPDMWTPILMQNRENILDVLNEHITQLRKFKSCLEKENWEYLNELMSKANQIRRIIH
jgi:hypothetical protein